MRYVGEIVRGKIVARVAGGLQVDVDGTMAFLPGSQIRDRIVHEPEQFIGQELDFQVIKLDEYRKNMVLSRRVLLDQIRREEIAKLDLGDVLKGVVRRVVEFGVFVDFVYFDGLLHVSQLSWLPRKPSDLFKAGDEITATVVNIDYDAGRVWLGRKRPWQQVIEDFPLGGQVQGRVIRLEQYGIFLELEGEVEGFIHFSEMSWSQRIRKPSKLIRMGDTIQAVVMGYDSPRLSLSMKRLTPNPWGDIKRMYPPGTRTWGTVCNVVDRGVFVHFGDSLEGLVTSDRLQGKAFKKGDRVEVVILELHINQRRFSLDLAGEDA